MPGHPEFVSAFDAGLRGGALPPGVTAHDPAEVERRFAVYRNNVAVSLTSALATRFPVVRQLVGEAFFTAMGRVYAEEERPRSPVLHEWGAGFAAFLERFPPLAGYPYLGDVARIEYARGVAFHAADGVPADGRAFLGADPEVLRLRLCPSVHLLRLNHPAVSIWSAHQPGAPKSALPAGPETALILRDRAFNVPVLSLGAGDAAMAEGLVAGAALADAARAGAKADPAHDPQPLLLHLMQAGVILQTESPE